MLRAALASGGSGSGAAAGAAALPDLPQLVLQRNRLLEERRQQRAGMQVASARTALVARVLGGGGSSGMVGGRAPKAARDEFEKYMRGKSLGSVGSCSRLGFPAC